MITVTVDTNILISAIFWRGNEYRLIKEAIRGKLRVVTSLEIINELEKILREKFEAPEERIEEERNILLSHLHLVEPKTKRNAIKDDPKDNKVLECAVAGKVDYIVSGDRHILDLKEYEGIEIVKAKELLKVLKKQSAR